MTGPVRLPVSRPVTVVDADATLAAALAVMDRLGVRHLPVVAAHGSGDARCVGLLLDRDLVLAVGADPAAADRPVRVVARTVVPRVAAGAPPREVARVMLDGGLDAALVVADGELVGIVTASDALSALAAPGPCDADDR